VTDIRILPATDVRYLPLSDLTGEFVIDYRRPKVYARRFKGVYAGPEGIAAENTQWLFHDFERQCDEGTGPRHTRAMVLLGGEKNFGHWMFEYLTKLVVIDRALGHLMNLAVWSDVPQTYVDFLELAGHTVTRVEPGFFDDIWVPSAPFGRTPDKRIFAWPEAVTHLRAALNRHRGIPRGRKIYAKRNAAKRRILNDDDVTDCLESHGFEVVDLATMSAREQILEASFGRYHHRTEQPADGRRIRLPFMGGD
jgi:capsular polysaccharide biosynthesis protein